MIERRTFITAGAGLVASLAVGSAGSSKAAADSADQASGRIVIDALGGIDNPNSYRDPSEKAGDRPDPAEVDPRVLSDLKISGVTAINVTLGYVAGPAEPFEKSVNDVADMDTRIHTNPEHFLKVFSADDILEAHRTGRVGIIYGFQNAAMMGDDADRVTTFARLGVRVIQLTYNVANQLGHGSMVPENRGLTDFGREVVAELNANDVLVDLSHSGEQTCLDAIEASTSPIAISHTGCRALADLPRNKTDNELKRLADRGGVVGIYFMPFLKVEGQPHARDAVDHVVYALKVCGEDHVGIGTDGSVTTVDDLDKYRDYIAKEVAQRKAAGIGAKGETADVLPLIPDMRGPHEFDLLAGHLAARGISERVVDKVLGRNFLRLMGDVWSGRAKTQPS